MSYYDDVVEIDMDRLEPHINSPHTPNLSHPLSKLSQAVRENSWPEIISAAFVGSCTNSFYEDLMNVSSIMKQENSAGLEIKTPFYVSPGSEQVRATTEDLGFWYLEESRSNCAQQFVRSLRGPLEQD